MILVNTYIDLLLVTAIIVFFVDLCGIVPAAKYMVARIITGRQTAALFSDRMSWKPIDCSLCMTFWAGFVYMLLTKDYHLTTAAYVCALSFTADLMKLLLIAIKDIIGGIFNLICIAAEKLNNYGT